MRVRPRCAYRELAAIEEPLQVDTSDAAHSDEPLRCGAIKLWVSSTDGTALLDHSRGVDRLPVHRRGGTSPAQLGARHRQLQTTLMI
jgi:hypothetical protein